MPTKKVQSIQIVKVPLTNKTLEYPQTFPSMPRLYLEIFENKEKVIPDLINKEYVPRESYTPTPPIVDNNIEEEEEDDRASIRFVEEDEEDEEEEEEEELEGVELEDGESINENIDNEEEEEEEEDISDRLNELLGEDDKNEPVSAAPVVPPPPNHTSKYSRQRKAKPAPSLASLEKQGEYVHQRELRDVNRVTSSEHNEEELKREMLFKFDMLRKSYPSATIPTYTIHTDYNTLRKSYEDTVKRLSLDASVESYKTYLIYGFMACEFLLGNFGGFDMQGFTQQQILTINTYEKLLIELGEKSYVPTGSKWPVEIRLLFMIIMNAAFFIVSKMMMKKTGANILNMVNNMNSTKPSTTSSNTNTEQKKKDERSQS